MSTSGERKIVEIMRDKAARRKSAVGDYWDDAWCDTAADVIERLTRELEEAKRTIMYLEADLEDESA